MKSFVKSALGVGCMLGLAGTAMAGQQLFNAVEVNTTTGYARGTMGDSRNSTDTQQTIGCTISSSPSYSYVSCEARNASGVYKTCISSDPSLFAAAQSIGSASYIFFMWNTAGNCTRLDVTNLSSLRPMTP